MDKLKQLRSETGVSYALCQKALTAAGGDLEKARVELQMQGAEVAKKKADRATDEGNVFSYIHHNKKIGALITLLCETDFVAKNDGFQEVGNDVAMQVASTNPENLEALLKEKFIKDPSKTIDDLVKGLVLSLGENISIGEMNRFEI